MTIKGLPHINADKVERTIKVIEAFTDYKSQRAKPAGGYSTANAELTKTDSVYVSPETQSLRNQLELFNTLETINGQPIGELRAVNNVLTIETGKFYRFPISPTQSIIISGGGGGWFKIPFEEIAKDLGVDMYKYFHPGVYDSFERMEFFLHALNGGTTWILGTNFSKQEVLDTFKTLGIEPGWVEIRNQEVTNRFYLRSDGGVWPESQIESSRIHFANTDWREQGFTEDSVLIVNGKEYRMDENGNIHIPKGEPIVQGYNVIWPKISPEWFMRGQAGITEPDSV